MLINYVLRAKVEVLCIGVSVAILTANGRADGGGGVVSGKITCKTHYQYNNNNNHNNTYQSSVDDELPSTRK